MLPIVVNFCLIFLGVAALWLKNKVPAWCLITAANALTLTDGVRQGDRWTIGLASAALGISAAWALVLARFRPSAR